MHKVCQLLIHLWFTPEKSNDNGELFKYKVWIFFHFVAVMKVCFSPEGSLSLSLSLSLAPSVSASYFGCELWFFALLSLLSSLTMKNSVCSRDGGGADAENDTGKEGKSRQLPSIREKKKESDWVQRENMLDWVGWAGGYGGIKYLSKWSPG